MSREITNYGGSPIFYEQNLTESGSVRALIRDVAMSNVPLLRARNGMGLKRIAHVIYMFRYSNQGVVGSNRQRASGRGGTCICLIRRRCVTPDLSVLHNIETLRGPMAGLTKFNTA